MHIYTATALGRVIVANPKLDRLYSRERTRYSVYRRLSGHVEHITESINADGETYREADTQMGEKY